MKRIVLAFAFVVLSAHAQPDAATLIDAVIARDARPSAAEAKPIADAGAVLLDVRTRDEWDAGHARSAVFLPWRQIGGEVGAKLPDKQAPVIVYCAVGARAWWAVRTLRGMGYTRVVAMSGGYQDMVKAGYLTESAARRNAP